jgi:NDP-sugar pyrophosphorylase family protein
MTNHWPVNARLFMPRVPDAVILCGGAGLRLRSVIGDAPKGMAEIAGRPFLELLLRQLCRYGFRRAILAVGYQRNAIREYFGDHALGMDLLYAEETSPLGTGGALRNAADRIASDSVLVMNGDSYTDVDLTHVLYRHQQSAADASVVVVPADGRSDCGFVLIDGEGKIRKFDEKQVPANGSYVNAGVYLLSDQMLLDIAVAQPVSLERELFPRWLREGRKIEGFVYSGQCMDIGTPDRYSRAQGVLANVEVEIDVPQGNQR